MLWEDLRTIQDLNNCVPDKSERPCSADDGSIPRVVRAPWSGLVANE